MKTPDNRAIPDQLVYQVTVAVVGLTGLINQSISVASTYNKISRGEKILEMMVSRGSLTPSGKDFLVAALDPMHDTQLPNLQGWPDLESASSVIRCFKHSKTISKPSSVTGNWDCVIQSFPLLNTLEMKLSSSRSNNWILPTANAGTVTWSPVSILSTTSGNTIDTTKLFDPITYPDYSFSGVDFDPTVLGSRGRLVGIGFEVNNTTSQLYKQGTVTVYRQPQQPALKSNTWFYASSSNGYPAIPFDASVFSNFPIDLGETMLLAGTRQWKAADGVYVVVPFAGVENPAMGADYRQPVFQVNSHDEVGVVNTTKVIFPKNISSLNDKLIFQANRFTPSQSCGAYFTGLSAETTLTLQVNFYYESFPTVLDTEIVTLAKPSADYDAVALALYQHALNSLPVGVPANMNGFGDWFAGIVSNVAKYGGAAIGSMVPGLGPVIAGAGALADSYLAAQTPKTRPAAKKSRAQAAQPPPKKRKERKSRNPKSLTNHEKNQIENDIVARLRTEGRSKRGRRK